MNEFETGVPSPIAARKKPLPQQPVGVAIRALVKRALDQADDACARLRKGEDGETLHDLRVALRRLSSIAHAWTPFVGDCLPKKLRKRIHALAAGTNTARDTEVQLAWLKQQHGSFRTHERTGHLWLVARLQRRLDAEYVDIRVRTPGDFARLRERIESRLASGCDENGEPIGTIAVDRLLEAATELRERLDEARRLRNETSVHKARIATKRLRYLFEPFAKWVPEGRSLVKELKSFQDLMGDIHDIQVFGEELTEAAQEAGAEWQKGLIELSLHLPHDDPQLEAARRGDERAGLISLARDLHERREDLLS